jgi:uncharacterized protein YcbK (DUF882 family)
MDGQRMLGQEISRRRLLLGAGCLMGTSLLSFPALASRSTSGRELSFFNLNTGERVRASYWEDGHYLSDGLAELNHIFRDYRRNEVFNIDSKLFDQLYCCSTSWDATVKSSSSRAIAPR